MKQRLIKFSLTLNKRERERQRKKKQGCVLTMCSEDAPYAAALWQNYLSLALFLGGCCWQHLISLSEYQRLPLRQGWQCDVLAGSSTGCAAFRGFESAKKKKVTPRQRKKTFIVYECGVAQVLSEKNREVRSWFEVCEIILPPLSFSSCSRQLDFGICSRQE